MNEVLAYERAMMEANWALVDVLGQLDVQRARAILRARWDAERARAASTLIPLRTESVVGPRGLQVYQGQPVQARFRRTLDYVRPGDRVFEIGPGEGLLACHLLRDGGADAYHGADVREGNLRSTRKLLALNDLADRGDVSLCDLYELTPERLAEFGADLLICCEVIEHVPDPEQALKTLAQVLPAGADLLISVPLLGRLEDVWGHIAMFDAARTRRMVEESGLVVHAVDVVDNMWVFVLASHQPGPNARATQAAEAQAGSLASGLSDKNVPQAMRAYALDSPEIGLSARGRGLARSRLEYGEDGVVCELAAARRPWSRRPAVGGVRLPVDAAQGVRLELAVDGLENVQSCLLDAYSGDRKVARWRWDPSVSRPKRSPATFTIRPGRGGRFKPVKQGDTASADSFELLLTVRPGASATIRLSRMAVIV